MTKCLLLTIYIAFNAVAWASPLVQTQSSLNHLAVAAPSATTVKIAFPVTDFSAPASSVPTPYPNPDCTPGLVCFDEDPHPFFPKELPEV
jgi:hypothetical protein